MTSKQKSERKPKKVASTNLGVPQVDAAEFVSVLFAERGPDHPSPLVKAGEFHVIASNPVEIIENGKPKKVWPAKQVTPRSKWRDDAYVNWGTAARVDDGGNKGPRVRATKEAFGEQWFLMLDDVNDPEKSLLTLDDPRVQGATYILETSPGNYQAGYAFSTPLGYADSERLRAGCFASKLGDKGSMQNPHRWCRVPGSVNLKPPPKYGFEARLVQWHPERRFTLDELVKLLDIKLGVAPINGKAHPSRKGIDYSKLDAIPDGRFQFLRSLKVGERGSLLSAKANAEGFFPIICPWFDDETHGHSGHDQSGTGYRPSTGGDDPPAFACHHAHGQTGLNDGPCGTAEFNRWADAERMQKLASALKPARPEAVEPPASSAWPAPPAGLLRDMVQAIMESGPKPDEAAATLAALTLASAIAGPRYRMGDGKPVAIFGMVIGKTGSGKDTPLQGVQRVLEAVAVGANEKQGPLFVQGKFASGEAVEDVLERRGAIYWVHDEAAHSSGGKKGAADPHRVSLDATILRLWNGGKYTTRPRANQRGKEVGGAVIARPFISILEATTPASIERYLTPASIDGGRFGRMLFASVPDDKPFEWLRQRPNVDMKLAGALRVIFNSAYPMAQEVLPLSKQVVGFSPEAEAVIERAGRMFDARRREARNESEVALQARSFEKVLRVASVLAILEAAQARWEVVVALVNNEGKQSELKVAAPGEPVVTAAQVEWAVRAVEASNAVVLSDIAQRLSDDDYEAQRLKVLDVVRRIVAGKLSLRNEQQRRFAKEGYAVSSAVLYHSKLGARDFDMAVATLVRGGQLATGTATSRGFETDPGRDPDLMFVPSDEEA